MKQEIIDRRNKYRVCGKVTRLTVTSIPFTVRFDTSDLAKVREYCWHYLYAGTKKEGGKWEYLGATVGSRILLHRLLAETPEGKECYFINGDSSDCRRKNLANVHHLQGAQWHHKPKNRCGERNIYFDTKGKTYKVMIQVLGQQHYGGKHPTLAEAVRVRDEMREKLFEGVETLKALRKKCR